VVESAELDPLDGRVAVQLGEQRPQPVAATQLVAAIGAHQHHRRLGQVGHQKRQQVQGRPVGPVQVLHSQHQRPLGRQPLHHPQQARKQPTPGQPTHGQLDGVTQAEVGDQPGQLPSPGTQHLLKGGRIELTDQLP
jgi:hypothetical protein